MATVSSMEEAVALIRPVDRIGFGLGPAIPDGLMTALGARNDWQDLQIGGALCLNLYDVFTKPGVSYRCGFFGPAERVHHAMGHSVQLVPGGFRQMGPIMARFAPRVMVAQATPPDDGGTVNLALHMGGTRDELLRAGRDPDRVLMVEVNPASAPHQEPAARVRQHDPPRCHRRAGGVRRRAIRTGGRTERRG